MVLYQLLKEHDKHLSRRYDGMTGSKYMLILAAQLGDSVIDVDELSDFQEEIMKRIVSVSGIEEDLD